MLILYIPITILDESCITIDYDGNKKHMSLKDLWEYFISFQEIINLIPIEILDFLNILFIGNDVLMEISTIIEKIKIIKNYCLNYLKNPIFYSEKHFEFINYLLILSNILQTFISN